VEADPAVVLVDLSLPGRSGLDLLAEIRDRWRLPCVVVSGHGERGHVGRAFAAGARGYVLKGRPHEVPAAIHQVLAGDIYLSELLRRGLDREEAETGA
jgi:DNA-binding NarL/FixJ family response regulator